MRVTRTDLSPSDAERRIERLLALNRLDAEREADGGVRECVCGTEIPSEGTDFEPGCRHCLRIRDFRLVESVGER